MVREKLVVVPSREVVSEVVSVVSRRIVFTRHTEATPSELPGSAVVDSEPYRHRASWARLTPPPGRVRWSAEAGSFAVAAEGICENE